MATSPGQIISECMFLNFLIIILFHLDTLKHSLNSSSSGIIYTGVENLTGELFILKFIHVPKTKKKIYKS
jgi:hypothetical protein